MLTSVTTVMLHGVSVHERVSLTCYCKRKWYCGASHSFKDDGQNEMKIDRKKKKYLQRCSCPCGLPQHVKKSMLCTSTLAIVT